MLVTGIGQCSLDYLARVEDYPEADAKCEVLRWEEQGGGPVATALVALRRLGVEARFYGVVGDDEAGGKIRASLVEEKVDVGGLKVRRGASSQTAFIVADGRGRRTIFWRKPSGAPLGPEELGRGFLEGADFLLLDGLMPGVSLHAAGKAGESGVPVMLDAGRVREGTLDLARLSDYVAASEEFGRQLGLSDCLETPEEFMRKAGGLFPGVFTITLGQRGSVTLSGGEVIYQPAFPVDVVDTTGAGDVFHGGCVFGLLKGWEPRQALRFASALAALKCRRPGGRAGIPTLEETLTFLRQHENI
jgi:ribokinase